MSVVGIDACKRGWIAIELRDGDVAAHFLAELGALFDHAPDVEIVAIDIPIGLRRAGQRQADVLARTAGRAAAVVGVSHARPGGADGGDARGGQCHLAASDRARH